MKKMRRILWVSLFAVLLSTATLLAADSDFTGSYCGTAGGKTVDGAYSESVVELLEVKAAEGGWRLNTTMNARWREPGMDHSSNTHSHWAARGEIRHGRLVFSANYGDGVPVPGTLIRKGRDLILVLEGVKYLLHPCASE